MTTQTAKRPIVWDVRLNDRQICVGRLKLLLEMAELLLHDSSMPLCPRQRQAWARIAQEVTQIQAQLEQHKVS